MTSGAGTLVDLLYTTCGNSPEWRILTHATRGHPPLVEFPRVADKWPKNFARHSGEFPENRSFSREWRISASGDNTRTQYMYRYTCSSSTVRGHAVPGPSAESRVHAACSFTSSPRHDTAVDATAPHHGAPVRRHRTHARLHRKRVFILHRCTLYAVYENVIPQLHV